MLQKTCPIACIVVCLISIPSVQAIGIRHDVANATSTGLDNPYVAMGSAYDAVVNLSWETHRGTFQASATLVSSTTTGEYKILTAAHVVDGNSGASRPDGLVDASSYTIEFGDNPDSILHRVTIPRGNVVAHPRWAPGDPAGTGLFGGAAQFDMAVITFTADDLTFGDANTLPDPYGVWLGNPLGEVATIVGFGQWGTGDDFINADGGPIQPRDGIRRAGQNVIDAVDSFSDEANDGYTIRADFDAPVSINEARNVVGFDGAVQTFEASTARGDSGGPLLVGPNLVAGVLHGGYNHFDGADISEYGDVGVWSSVNESLNRQFLELNGVSFYGYDVASDTASIATVPEPSTAPLLFFGFICSLRFVRQRSRVA